MVMRHFALPFNMDDWETNQGISGLVEFTYTGSSEELVIQFEDIFKEINKLVDYYRFSLSNDKQDVTKFLVNGDHPMLKAILDEMSERFEVTVQMLSLSSDEKAKSPIPSNLLISLGLALKEVQ
jgi:type IV pilus assembly protein PilM